MTAPSPSTRVSVATGRDSEVEPTTRTSHNKHVAGSAHFVRSGLHGPKRMWPGSWVQRILEVARVNTIRGGPRRKRLNVIGHVSWVGFRGNQATGCADPGPLVEHRTVGVLWR
jgi:hypothetical protein